MAQLLPGCAFFQDFLLMVACVSFQPLYYDDPVTFVSSPILTGGHDAYALAISTTETIENCTTYLLYSASDFPVYSVTDVVEISSAVVLVWAIAYSFKVLRRSF